MLLLDRCYGALRLKEREAPKGIPAPSHSAHSLLSFVSSTGKVKHLRLKLRPRPDRGERFPPTEISTRRRLEILLLEAGNFYGLGPWTTHWHRFRAFLRSDRSLHRCITRTRTDELVCRARFNGTGSSAEPREKVHLSLAPCTRDARSYAKGDKRRHIAVSFFHRRWITLEKIHLDYAAIASAPAREKARVSSWERTNESHHRLVRSFPIDIT